MNTDYIDRKFYIYIFFISSILIFSIFAKSFYLGNIFSIGIDSDDMMRLVQVRDYLSGQSWFDLHQYRLGVDGGTPMHWSRIPDLPLIGLIWLGQSVLSYEDAEKFAYTIWPPLTGLIVVYASTWGACLLSNRTAGLWAGAIAALVVIFVPRFQPGAIDHHGLQFGLILLCVAGLLSRKRNAGHSALSGIAAATSAMIGLEVYFFVAVICIYVASIWFLEGVPARLFAAAFGGAFCLTFTVGFFGTVASPRYLEVHCDAYSSITWLMGSLGGLGLSAIALSFSKVGVLGRGALLALLGAVCVSLMVLLAPQCLTNPLNDLPEELHRFWLDHVVEAESLSSILARNPSLFFVTVGTPLTGLFICLFRIVRREQVSAYLLIAMMISTSLVLAVIQVRFVQFAPILSIVPISLAAYDLHYYRQEREQFKLLPSLFLAVLATPALWGVPILIEQQFSRSDNANANANVSVGECDFDEITPALDAIPQGTIAASPNYAQHIIAKTHHRAAGGNYHRNVQGNMISIGALNDTDGKNLKAARDAFVDYVLVCTSDAFSIFLLNENKDNLIGKIGRGETPEGLLRVTLPDTVVSDQTDFVLFEIVDQAG